MSAFYGKFAWVDLATGQVDVREIPEDDLRMYFGGGGLAAKLFLDEKDDDALVIANGMLTGFHVPTACKTSLVFRSPLTGIFGESNVGGKFGAQLKRTGIDGLVITGRSETPVTLFVGDDGVDIQPADDLWGLDTFTAHGQLAARLPEGTQIGVIGPAGENGVAFASVMFEGEFARAAGRTGIGAKFGEMRIKAIAAKGSKSTAAHDRAALGTYVRQLNAQIRERTAGLHNFGTAGAVQRREKSGDLPIRNFALGNWADGAKKITGQSFVEQMLLRHHACFMCPIGCAKKIEIREGRYAGLQTTQPEYETVGALGSNLMLDDPAGVAIAHRECNRLGLDTISAGVVAGFLFECCERGIVDPADVGLKGTEPTWGNTEALVQLIEMITYRRGIGEVLAQGVRHAAKTFGGGSERFAIHAKGLELPMHDPRALVSAGATYATGNRGASHNEAPAYYLEEGMKIEGFPEGVNAHTPDGKGAMTAKMQDLSALFDALGLCKFLLAGGISQPQLQRFVELTFGWEMSAEEMWRVGERIYAIKRIYNQLSGLDGRHDTLPARLLEEPRPTGDAAGVLPDLPTMLRDLYVARGWDADGRVGLETARALGLAAYLESSA